MKKILITGGAGFIGSHLVDKLLKQKLAIVCVDNFNNYYDPNVKRANLKQAIDNKHFRLYTADIFDFTAMKSVFSKEKPDVVVHLGARAGVRPSIDNPVLYAEVNKIGTVNLLKLSVDYNVSKFIFGSSSSVYGNSDKIPFTEDDPCSEIISPYGASKRAAEIFIETFSRLYGLKAVVLRFFTVYGPRGRPDMAPALFTQAIMAGEKINRFGGEETFRDYTYIDDIVLGIIKSIYADLTYEVINLGNSNPVSLSEFIRTIEKTVGKKAVIKKAARRAGDAQRTWANIGKAKKLLAWKPETVLSDGLGYYINWIKQTYR